MSCGDIFLGLIAILFPPIAVWIKSGICSCDSLINILLCMLGYLPGLLHAWYIIAIHPEHNLDYEAIPDAESQRVTYYYIHTAPAPRPNVTYGSIQAQGQHGPPPPPPKPQNQKQKQSHPSQQSGNTGSADGNSSRPVPPPQSHAEGPSVGAGSHEAGAPPSYSEVVKGDHKIQTPD